MGLIINVINNILKVMNIISNSKVSLAIERWLLVRFAAQQKSFKRNVAVMFPSKLILYLFVQISALNYPFSPYCSQTSPSRPRKTLPTRKHSLLDFFFFFSTYFVSTKLGGVRPAAYSSRDTVQVQASLPR